MSHQQDSAHNPDVDFFAKWCATKHSITKKSFSWNILLSDKDNFTYPMIFALLPLILLIQLDN